MAICSVCPLCDEPGSIYTASEVALVPSNVRRFSDHRFTVWRCCNCKSIHSYEDANLSFYYAHLPFRQQRLDFATRVGYRNRVNLLRQRGLLKSHRILDFGCGAGLFVDYLRGCGYRNVAGYDAYVDAYADSSVLDSEYDAVVSYDVIEHVANPRRLIAALQQLVTPGGLLAIGTPNADEIRLTDENALCAELSQPYHRHLLSENALLTIAEANGLVAEHTYRRFYMDSLIPGVNSRFIWNYIAATGGMIDAAVEPPRIGLILRSPGLLFDAFAGYLFPSRTNILIVFRNTGVRAKFGEKAQVLDFAEV